MAIQDQQQTYSQHAVPQNIMDVEFKLIGDLTMRQFTYLMIFGLLAYVTFMAAVGIFRIPLALFFVLFGLALAFLPIEERGMDEWVVNFIKSVYSPTQRVWKKEPVLPPAFTYENIAVVRQEMITLAPTSSRRKLEDYLQAKQGDQEVDKLDIPEREFVLKVRQAFAPPAPPQAAVGVAVEDDFTPSETEFESYKPFKAEHGKEPTEEKPVEQKPVEEKPAEQHAVEKFEQKPVEQKPVEEKPRDQAAPQPESKSAPQPKPQAPGMRSQESIIKQRQPSQKPQQSTRDQLQSTIIMPRRSDASNMTYNPITPDMHVGRKFSSMLPGEGQLVLPVRGEKVIATSEELDIEKDIEEKTAQLRQLLDQVKGDAELAKELEKAKEVKKEDKEAPVPASEAKSQPQPQPPKTDSFAPPETKIFQKKPDVKVLKDEEHRSKKQEVDLEQVRRETQHKMDLASKKQAEQAKISELKAQKDSEVEEAKKIADKVKDENQRLINQITGLRNEINKSDESEEEKAKKREIVAKLEQQRQDKSADYAALQKQILELQKKLEEKEKPQPAQQEDQKQAQPQYAQMEPITEEPNIVSGVIKKPGNESIPGLVLLIKNHRGEAVRALKTNAMGQFAISTPLVDGIYTLEVGSVVEGLSFDIITIEVKGEVIPPVQLIGKEV